MCGIAGIYQQDASSIQYEVFRRMSNAIEHRGPDDNGILAFDSESKNLVVDRDFPEESQRFNVALSHKRLSIIDLSEDGRQPMPNEDRTLWLIFNGEIYNYIELKSELLTKGHRFFSQTDSEVILHAYEEWGGECLHKLNGMWAFAIFDTKNQNLFCARDRYGIKPFYYTKTGSNFYFASEMKALLCLEDVSSEVDTTKILRYLAWGVTDEDNQTLIKSIKRLAPGHYLNINKDRFETEAWYGLSDRINIKPNSELKNQERFKTLFTDSVRLRMRSDVSVGTCLSGGLDSTAIVRTIHELPQNGFPLSTFSAVFEGESMDESRYIRETVEMIQAKAHYVTPKADELLAELEDVIYFQDEPFWSSSVYHHYRVMRLAKEAGVKVLLDGQGADELLAGYDFYFSELILHLLKTGQWRRLQQELSSIARDQHSSQLKLFLHAFSLSLPAQFRFWLQRLLNSPEKAVINRDLISGGDFYKGYESVTSDRILNRNFYDFSYTLPYLLRLEDRNSMAFSLESRVPFLDYRLVEFLFTVPAEQKIRLGETKYLMRKSLQDLLPQSILQRRDKIGFFGPEHRWIRETLNEPIRDTFHSQKMRERGFYNMPVLQKHFERFLTGKENASYVIWRWFNLEKWFGMIEERF